MEKLKGVVTFVITNRRVIGLICGVALSVLGFKDECLAIIQASQ